MWEVRDRQIARPLRRQDRLAPFSFPVPTVMLPSVLGRTRRGAYSGTRVLGDTAFFRRTRGHSFFYGAYSGTQLFLGCPFTPIWVVSLRVRSALQLPAPFVDRSTDEFDVATQKIS